MSKETMANEIQVLRFFENQPIETARPVFNIVAEKMRNRLRGRERSTSEPLERNPVRKGRARTNADAPRENSESPPST